MSIEFINKKYLENNSYEDIFIIKNDNDIKIYFYPTYEEKIIEKKEISLDEYRKYVLDIINSFLGDNEINGVEDRFEDKNLTLFSNRKYLHFFGYDEYFFELIEKIKKDFFTFRKNLLKNEGIKYYSFSENCCSGTAYIDIEYQKIYFALANKDMEPLPKEVEFLDDFLDFFFTLNDSNNIIIYPKIYWNKQDNPELQGYYLENGDKVFNCPLYLCSYVMKKAEEYENKESLKLNRMLLVKRKNDKVDC